MRCGRCISDALKVDIQTLEKNLEELRKRSRDTAGIFAPARFTLIQDMRYVRGHVAMLKARLVDITRLQAAMNSVIQEHAVPYRLQGEDGDKARKVLSAQAWAKRKGLNIDPDLLSAFSGADWGGGGCGSVTNMGSAGKEGDGEEEDDTDEDWGEELVKTVEGEGGE